MKYIDLIKTIRKHIKYKNFVLAKNLQRNEITMRTRTKNKQIIETMSVITGYKIFFKKRFFSRKILVGVLQTKWNRESFSTTLEEVNIVCLNKNYLDTFNKFLRRLREAHKYKFTANAKMIIL
jgi:hypothetical protein